MLCVTCFQLQPAEEPGGGGERTATWQLEWALKPVEPVTHLSIVFIGTGRVCYKDLVRIPNTSLWKHILFDFKCMLT